MIYRPDSEIHPSEKRYVTLYNSVMHHLMEALDNQANAYASMLFCVLYGAFASQFPPDHNAHTPQGYTAFMSQVTEELRQPGVEEILHEIPHIPPHWINC